MGASTIASILAVTPNCAKRLTLAIVTKTAVAHITRNLVMASTFPTAVWGLRHDSNIGNRPSDLWHPACPHFPVPISFALVHHANQYLITDGYANREGISDIVGSESNETGILAVLAVHEA